MSAPARAIQAANGYQTPGAALFSQLSQRQERLTHAGQHLSRGIQSAAALAGTGMAARATGMSPATSWAESGVGYEFDAPNDVGHPWAVTASSARTIAGSGAAATGPHPAAVQQIHRQEVGQGQTSWAHRLLTRKEIPRGLARHAQPGRRPATWTSGHCCIASNNPTAMGIHSREDGPVADVLTAAFTRNNVASAARHDSLKYSAGVGASTPEPGDVKHRPALPATPAVQCSMAGNSMRLC